MYVLLYATVWPYLASLVASELLESWQNSNRTIFCEYGFSLCYPVFWPSSNQPGHHVFLRQNSDGILRLAGCSHLIVSSHPHSMRCLLCVEITTIIFRRFSTKSLMDTVTVIERNKEDRSSPKGDVDGGSTQRSEQGQECAAIGTRGRWQ
jgi:hypothetical protein